jgi:hypothetical protein
MKWKNVHLDGVPNDKQEVLISANGIYHLAVYDATYRVFKLHEHIGKIFPIEGAAMLYWLRLEPFVPREPGDENRQELPA